MNADDFNAAIARLGLSRRKLCERIGVSRRSADGYALGRAPVPVPRTVELAIRAVEAGLDHDHCPPARRRVEGG